MLSPTITYARTRPSRAHEQKLHADFNLVVTEIDCQTAKFNSPPNFLAIRYFTHIHCTCTWKFSHMEKIFTFFAHCFRERNVNFCNDYIESMTIFTAWAKIIYSAKYFFNARVSGLEKKNIPAKFSWLCYAYTLPLQTL